MSLLEDEINHRILVIDDNEAIHEDFRKILTATSEEADVLRSMATSIFDAVPQGPIQATISFKVEHAHQGREGFDKVKAAVHAGRPYAVAFVDVRMPPGWDGIETVTHLWKVDHEIETVICTAYSDFSWEEIVRRLHQPERLLILKKPFDAIEVRQLALSLTAKWALRRQASCRMEDLEIMVEERTRQIEELVARKAGAQREHLNAR